MSLYPVASGINAVVNLDLAYAMKWSLTAHELTKYASKSPNINTGLLAMS